MDSISIRVAAVAKLKSRKCIRFAGFYLHLGYPPEKQLNSMKTTLFADSLLTPEELVKAPLLVVEDGVIASIEPLNAKGRPPLDNDHLFPGCTMVPAYFDVHTHGAAGHDVMEATPAALDTISIFLASRGVGAYLATTVTAPLDSTLKSLEGLAVRIEGTDPGARMLGIHLEGPFLSHHKRGVHPAELLLEPSIQLFDRFWQAARGHIRLLTIAPELPGACELIAYATKLGIRISLGHSNAGASESRQAIAAGACSATHTFNAMRSLDHRNSGILDVVLTTDELFAEIISDGIHVSQNTVKLFWRAKGPERAILVTDAMSAAGMSDGAYMLGRLCVEVADGKCMNNGVLAGSVLTMDRAVRNFAAFTGAPIGSAIALATRNPARMTGFESSIGMLATGRRADIAVLSAKGEVVAMVLNGRFMNRP